MAGRQPALTAALPSNSDALLTALSTVDLTSLPLPQLLQLRVSWPVARLRRPQRPAA
jgi:hypothetical protein